MEAVRLQVKHIWERAERVYFIILKRIEVEADPLQMHNENVGRRGNHCTLLEVYFALATIAIVVIDYLSFDELFKRLFNRFDTLDRQREVKVVFHTILDFTTLGTDHLTALFASKDSIDKILARSGLQSFF